MSSLSNNDTEGDGKYCELTNTLTRLSVQKTISDLSARGLMAKFKWAQNTVKKK